VPHKIESCFADHQNKPDIVLNIVRQWFDVDKVMSSSTWPTSSVAAPQQHTRKEQVFLVPRRSVRS